MWSQKNSKKTKSESSWRVAPLYGEIVDENRRRPAFWPVRRYYRRRHVSVNTASFCNSRVEFSGPRSYDTSYYNRRFKHLDNFFFNLVFEIWITDLIVRDGAPTTIMVIATMFRVDASESHTSTRISPGRRFLASVIMCGSIVESVLSYERIFRLLVAVSTSTRKHVRISVQEKLFGRKMFRNCSFSKAAAGPGIIRSFTYSCFGN